LISITPSLWSPFDSGRYMFPASCFLPQTLDYWTILLTKLVNKNKLNKIDTTYMVENIIHIWVSYLYWANIFDVQNHLLLIQWIFKCILVAVAMMECVESWSMSSSFVQVPDMRWDLLPHINHSMFCFQWVEEEVSVLAVGTVCCQRSWVTITYSALVTVWKCAYPSFIKEKVNKNKDSTFLKLIIV
jgi:hypothetical protein